MSGRLSLPGLGKSSFMFTWVDTCPSYRARKIFHSRRSVVHSERQFYDLFFWNLVGQLILLLPPLSKMYWWALWMSPSLFTRVFITFLIKTNRTCQQTSIYPKFSCSSLAWNTSYVWWMSDFVIAEVRQIRFSKNIFLVSLALAGRSRNRCVVDQGDVLMILINSYTLTRVYFHLEWYRCTQYTQLSQTIYVFLGFFLLVFHRASFFHFVFLFFFVSFWTKSVSFAKVNHTN